MSACLINHASFNSLSRDYEFILIYSMYKFRVDNDFFLRYRFFHVIFAVTKT